MRYQIDRKVNKLVYTHGEIDMDKDIHKKNTIPTLSYRLLQRYCSQDGLMVGHIA